MFLGEYSHTIDSKGRLIIPSKYREEIGDEKLVIAKWWDNNLVVFKQEYFREYVRSLDQLQGSPAKQRMLKRYITTGADECRLDGQGRITINKTLRDFAGLNGDVIISGNMESFEIWNPDVWAKTGENLTAEEMSEALESLEQTI